MPDLENVIKGLECCILGNKHNPDCDICPYSADCNESRNTMDELFKDAIALLKAQEPRLMTLEEVLAAEVVYAEDVDKAEIIPVLINRRAHDRIVLIRAHLMGSPSYVIYPLISEYSKRFRCWTSRPTDAQRETTPWQTK